MTFHYLFTFIGGALYAYGFPRKEMSHNLLFAHMGVFLLYYLIEKRKEEKKRFIVLSILSFSLAYNLVGYYWIPETLKEFGEIAFPINYLLGTIFSLFIVPHIYIFVFLKRFIEKRYHYLFTPTLSAIAISLLEYLIPQQFPAHLGHTFLDLAPYLPFAPIFGPTIYSFIGYFIIFNIIDTLIKPKRTYLFNVRAIFISILLIFNFIFPLEFPQNYELFPVRLVQANIGNLLKIEAEKGIYDADETVIDRYKTISISPQQDIVPRLIVWPETAYPDLNKTYRFKSGAQKVPRVLRSITQSQKSYLFTGGYDHSPMGIGQFETQYNSALFFSPDGSFIDVYHKSKLIPFGESLPFGPLNSYLANINPNIAFFAKGKRFPLFSIDNKYRFTSSICYEALFSSHMRDYILKHKQDPHFIINVTNDSWYGDTAEPLQHKYLAHWRALEFQIPMIRMTNTGISNILYQDGSESVALTHGQEKHLDLNMKLAKPHRTLFAHMGIFNFILFSLLVLSLEFLLKPLFHQIVKAKEP